MNYQNFTRQLKSQNLQAVYLFHGDEEFIKERIMNSLISTLFTNPDSFNIQRFDHGAEPSQVLEACETLPFIDARRLVIWRNPLLFVGRSANATRDNDDSFDEATVPEEPTQSRSMSASDDFEHYLATPCPTTCLVLYVSGKADTRSKLYKRLQGMDAVVEFIPLDGAEMLRWVRQTLQQEHKSITPDAMEALLYLGGRQLRGFYEELMKLCTFMGLRPEITLADVEAVLTPTLEFTVFQMLDHLGERRVDEALRMLGALLQRGERAAGILALLIRHLRHLYYVKALDERRITAAQIQSALQIAPFVYRKASTQARHFTLEGLRLAIAECMKADIALKTGELRDEQLALYSAVLSMIV